MTRFLTTPVLYGLLALLVLSTGYNVFQAVQKANLRTELAESKAENATMQAAIASEREAFSEAARIKEQQDKDRQARNDAETQKRIADDKAATDRLVADLRADRVRFHGRWQAALATSRLSARSAALAGTYDPSGDVEASLGRVLKAARDHDTQIIGLQNEVKRIVATCNGEAQAAPDG